MASSKSIRIICTTRRRVGNRETHFEHAGQSILFDPISENRAAIRYPSMAVSSNFDMLLHPGITCNTDPLKGSKIYDSGRIIMDSNSLSGPVTTSGPVLTNPPGKP